LTRSLQVLFILTLGLILFFWIGDFFLGVPAEISDSGSTEHWGDDKALYESEKLKLRLWTLIYAIPTLVLLITTVKSIRHKNELLFYWSFLIGLSFFQILPIAWFFSEKENDPPFIIPVMTIFFSIFTIGQVISVIRILKLRKGRG
jgi:drug/metabolite transporter (DMT)-like permease